MALNVSVFKVRTLSAIVFAVVMLGGLLWNKWSFFVLFVAIQAGCLFEYQKLCALITPNYKNVSKLHYWGLLFLGIVLMFALASSDLVIKGVSIKTIGMRVIPFVIGIIVIADLVTKKVNFQNWVISFFGLVYIPMSLSIFYQLRGLMAHTIFGDMGYVIPLVLILSIWVNDTMAYLVGSFIGRTPLSSISPNKTWEGTVAGVILSVFIVTKTVGSYLPISEKVIFTICLTASIVGTIGDLFESKLKRMAGVKDSGRMMPGHGGFLDRFDSILLATPFVWLILQILF